jgi:D-arginine dehydrogenase
MGSPDVVVVGGGIAGASVAYELAASRSVLLVEAEPELGRHSTARSAATYIPGHGVGVVRSLITSSGPRFAALADELGTPPLLVPRDVVWVAVDDAGERSLVEMLAERDGEPEAPVRIDVDDALRRCAALAPGTIRAAGITTTSADVETDALHQGYVRGLRARGGAVLAGARVRALARHGAGWRVTAADQEIDTALVVDAAGAWADEVAALAGVPCIGLQPFRRTIAVARVPDPARLRGPGRQPMVIEAGERFYFKSEGDDLMVSAADETPVAACDARPDDLDVALAMERVEAVTALGLRSVRTSWAGLRSFVPDRAPVIGSLPEHPGFAFVAGQGGSGIESSPALSVLAAAVLTGAPVPADITVDPAAVAPTRL